jgi:hypothetical protein
VEFIAGYVHLYLPITFDPRIIGQPVEGGSGQKVNSLNAATSLGVKRFRVLNTTINIKDIL